MITTIEAIYEQGVLRPLESISLTEGTRVKITILSSEPTSEKRTPQEILAAIAAMPLEADGEEFSEGVRGDLC